MKNLTRKEELVLLSIISLKNRAYLIAIVDHLSEVTGKKISLTSVHLPLSRLEKNGIIESSLGEATAVRGGRRKKIYRISKSGLEALEEYRRISEILWADYRKYSTTED